MDTLTTVDLLRTLLEALSGAPLVLLLLVLLFLALFRPTRRPTTAVMYVPVESYERDDAGSGCLPLLLLLVVLLVLLGFAA